ncbi:MAG: hypothetical protein AAFX85_02970 [Pseudomonadota bacterium]
MRTREGRRFSTAFVLALGWAWVLPVVAEEPPSLAQEQAEARARCDVAETAADSDPVARHTLGVCYLLGAGRLTDHRRALGLFASAAEEGVREAAFSHAAALLFKVGEASRFAEATRALSKLASEGYLPAHFPLGVAYVGALGVEEDAERGLREFAVAAGEGRDDVAAWLLAVVYRYGLLGQPANEDLAWQYVGVYLANLRRQYPSLEFSAERLREAARALHHDRLLRRHVFTDRQLELFLALAQEVIERPDLARLRRDWVTSSP